MKMSQAWESLISLINVDHLTVITVNVDEINQEWEVWGGDIYYRNKVLGNVNS